ncbi:hypothetical protein AX16_004208 [Volvariella volvacea WC 439]|nr:hypothetical protein AX16_004208 [Volvariella volvacea WC 439]
MRTGCSRALINDSERSASSTRLDTVGMEFDPTTHPHRRFNPLTGEHILVSPHRTKRPWLGQVEARPVSSLPQFDPECYLCPGNKRSSGQENPRYEHTHVFTNDFAAVLPPPLPDAPKIVHPLLVAEPVHGDCDVIIFHPRHDLTLARLSQEDILRVIEEWTRIYSLRGNQEGIKYVQIFENKGPIMGCSNPHPHGQVWSLSAVPTIPLKELSSLKNYSQTSPPNTGAPTGPQDRPCLLCDYGHMEMDVPPEEGRIVVNNSFWVALVPWWATWPFEILLLPYKRHIQTLTDLTEYEKAALAEILSCITKRYDNLFSCSFPYSMGIHQRPVPPTSVPDLDLDVAHLHFHFAPPLLRSASVKKFLVGYELMAEAQRDLTPEEAAKRLRQCSEIHYLDQQ